MSSGGWWAIIFGVAIGIVFGAYVKHAPIKKTYPSVVQTQGET